MQELTQEQVIRTYNVVDLGETETIEKAYLGKNTLELTIRDTKRDDVKSFTLILNNDLKTFILNGVKLTREPLC